MRWHGSTVQVHAWYGGTRFAHDGRVAKLGKPASNMALTYQIHSLQTALPEIKYCYNDKMLAYGPGNMFYRQTRTVYSHSFSGEQFYLALILLKVIWVEAIFFDNFFFVNFCWKIENWRDFVYWTLKSSHLIMVNNDKNGVFKNTHFLLAHSGINRMKAF